MKKFAWTAVVVLLAGGTGMAEDWPQFRGGAALSQAPFAKVPLAWDATKPNGQPRRMLDTSRALREFGWKARIPFETGLAETVAWYEENRS